jgi:hypothetical protein
MTKSSNYFYVPQANSVELGQGDIFSSLPFIEIDSPKVVELIAEGDQLVPKEIDLVNYISSQPRETNLAVKSTLQAAIIITQNCDLLRSDYVSYCKVTRLRNVEKNMSDSQGKRIKFLTKTYREQAKYYYLPAEQPYGFEEDMAVDFSSIHQIKKEVLEQLLNKRTSRLNDMALDHFREKMANYFKRFAYDGWYVLNKSDFEFYLNTLEENEKVRTSPYGWQM